MDKFIATIHPDQADRIAFANNLTDALIKIFNETPKSKIDKVLERERHNLLLGSEKWGEQYQIALWNASLKKAVIHEQWAQKGRKALRIDWLIIIWAIILIWAIGML